jgi:hypothetical protein
MNGILGQSFGIGFFTRLDLLPDFRASLGGQDGSEIGEQAKERRALTVPLPKGGARLRNDLWSFPESRETAR